MFLVVANPLGFQLIAARSLDSNFAGQIARFREDESISRQRHAEGRIFAVALHANGALGGFGDRLAKRSLEGVILERGRTRLSTSLFLETLSGIVFFLIIFFLIVFLLVLRLRCMKN